MRKVIISSSQVEQFAKEIQIAKNPKAKILSKGANSHIFQIAAPEKKYILTVLQTPLDTKTKKLIQSGSEYFRRMGFPLPEVVAISKIDEFDVLLTEYLPGKVINQWSHNEYALVGKLLGALHSAGEHFPKEELRPPLIFSLRLDFESIRDQLPSPFLKLEGELDSLQEAWPMNLPCGLIHSDIWFKNILFKDQGISAILDFTMPTYDLFALDLATLIKGIYFSSGSKYPNEDLNSLLLNYQEIRPLSLEETDALETMLRCKILYTILYLLKKSITNPELKENFFNLASFNMLKLEDAKHISFAKILA